MYFCSKYLFLCFVEEIFCYILNMKKWIRNLILEYEKCNLCFFKLGIVVYFKLNK